MSTWKPIEDLPADWEYLGFNELGGFAHLWGRIARDFKASAVAKFNERLRREWAIETGIVEGVYHIDRGTTVQLIEGGFKASLMPRGSTDLPPEEIIEILRDHEQALDWLFDFVSQRRQLSTGFIKELHALLMRHQDTTLAQDPFGKLVRVPLLKGSYKTRPNNPTRPDGEIHHYAPPEHVESEMDRLLAWHREHVVTGVPTVVEAAWLHHRFTQIHPFQDGNGRMARSLATLVLLRDRLFPLTIDRNIRTGYIDTLEKADAGNLVDLCELFSNIQRSVFRELVSISALSSSPSIEEVINASARQLNYPDFEELRARVHSEAASVELRIQEVMLTVAQQLGAVGENIISSVEKVSGEEGDRMSEAVRESAKALGYAADTRTYVSHLRLSIQAEREFAIIYSLHGIGALPTGVVAGIVHHKSEFKEMVLTSADIAPLQFIALPEYSLFKHNHLGEWMNKTMAAALDEWRRQL